MVVRMFGLHFAIRLTFLFSSYLKPFLLHNFLSPSRLWNWVQHKWFTVYRNLSTELWWRTFLTIFSNSTLIFFTTLFCMQWHLGPKTSACTTSDRSAASVNPQFRFLKNTRVCWRKMPHYEQLYFSWFVSSLVLEKCGLVWCSVAPIY